MNEHVEQFLGKVSDIVSKNRAPTGVIGTTNSQSVLMDLLKESSKLPAAIEVNKTEEQIEEITGVLHVVQAMNLISFDELRELIITLDNMKGKEELQL